MNGRHARKLRKLTNFEPHTKRYYYQFNNSNNYVLSESGGLEKALGTIIEVTKDGNVGTPRANYRLMKERWYGRTF